MKWGGGGLQWLFSVCRRGDKEGKLQRTARVILSRLELWNHQIDARLRDMILKKKWCGEKKQQFPSQRRKAFEAPPSIRSKTTRTALTLISAASVRLTFKWRHRKTGICCHYYHLVSLPWANEVADQQAGHEQKKEPKAQINTGQHQTHNEGIDCTATWLQPQCNAGGDSDELEDAFR